MAKRVSSAKRNKRVPQVLARLRAAPMGSPQELESMMPIASAYRLLELLRAEGLVTLVNGMFVLTQAGRTEHDRIHQPRQRPRLQLKHFELAPTSFHRSLMELITCAVVTRTYGQHQTQNAGFVFIGPSKGGKTWIVRALLHMFDGALLNLPDMTYEHIFLARDGTVTPSEHLARPVLGLDEYGEANGLSGVKRAVKGLLRGDRDVVVDRRVQKVRIASTPIVITNPVDDSPCATWEKRTGLGHAALTRVTLAWFGGGVKLPRTFKTDATALLQQVEALGRVPIPAPALDLDARERVQQLLEAIAIGGEEMPDLINGQMVAQLVPGARPWVASDEDAIAAVLYDYAEVVAELGLLRPDWEAILDREFAVEDAAPAPVEVDPASTGAAPIPDEPEEIVEEAVIAHMPEVALDPEVLLLHERAMALGLPLDAALDALEARAQSLQACDQLGVSHRDAGWYIELGLHLERQAKRQGMSVADVLEAGAVGQAFARLGLGASDVAVLADELARIELPVVEGARLLVLLAREYGDLDRARDKASSELEGVRRILAATRQELDSLPWAASKRASARVNEEKFKATIDGLEREARARNRAARMGAHGGAAVRPTSA